MKLTTTHLHFLLLFIFCFPCSFTAFGTTADAVINNGEKIIRANWPALYMGTYLECDNCTALEWQAARANGGTPCIAPKETGKIKIGLSLEVQDMTYYNQFCPDIYLKYSVDNQSPVIIPASNMLQSGNTFFTTITVQFTNIIGGRTFQYTFELVTINSGNVIPYPIDDYPNLFVEYDDQNAFPVNNKTVLSGEKMLCTENGFSSPDPFNPNNLHDPTDINWSHLFDLELDLTDLNIIPIVPLQSSNTSTIEEYATKNRLNPISTTTSTLQLQAYPNPFSNQLHLEGNIAENTTIKLFDTQGKLMYYEKIDTFTKDLPKTIDTSSFPLGMYYCQIKNDTSSQTIKIIKQ